MTEPTVIDTDTLPWEMDGLSGQETAPGYRKKTLLHDPETTRRIGLLDVAAGYGDSSAYHDSAEEGFFISGDCHLTGEGDFGPGFYFWRPAGFVHAASTRGGFVALVMTEGLNPTEASDRTSRVPWPDSAAGTNALHSGGDDFGPRGWVRNLDTSLLPWWPAAEFGRGQGSITALDLDRAEVKILSTNTTTGAQTLLVRLQRGFESFSGGVMVPSVTAYVLEGTLDTACGTVRDGGFVDIPAGSQWPGMRSEQTSLLFVKSSGRLDISSAA